MLTLPSTTLISTTAFIAEDLGLYAREGLNVSTRVVSGVGAVNAVLAGSADFTMGTGPVFLRAAAHGQRFVAIANVIDHPMVELVLRKDVAARVGISSQMNVAKRASRLAGLTIAIQGVGSMVHAWQRYVARLGGLDADRDVRIAPMDASAMLPALQQKTIDGFATSLPFTTQAVMDGDAVMVASSVTDAPELVPFAYGLVYALPDTCVRREDVCRRMARVFATAARLVQDDPQRVFDQVLRKRFATMPLPLLSAAWQLTRTAHAKDVRVTTQELINSQMVSVRAMLLDPSAALTSYEGLFTDRFLD